MAEKPQPSIIYVDPATARRWLSKNHNNRTLNLGTVARYACDMNADRWHFTGEALKFDTDGRLIDGQHRLAALVQCDVTLPFLVVRNVPAAAQAFMDTGRKRTVADQLKLAGFKNVTALAAGARLALAWDRGVLAGRGSKLLTDAEVREFVDSEPSLAIAADIASNLSARGLDLHPSVTCACIWQFTRSGSDLAATVAWFESLAELRTHGKGDPRLALLSRIANARRSRERMSQEEQVGLAVRAWNADVANKPMHKMPTLSRSGTVIIPRPLRRVA